MIEKAQGKEERQGRGRHFDSNWEVIGGSASFLMPIPAMTTKFNRSLYHTRMVSGDTTKYTSVERTVHRLMVLVLLLMMKTDC